LSISTKDLILLKGYRKIFYSKLQINHSNGQIKLILNVKLLKKFE
jgi:hypothetical protein